MPQKILTLLENCNKVKPEKQQALVDVTIEGKIYSKYTLQAYEDVEIFSLFLVFIIRKVRIPKIYDTMQHETRAPRRRLAQTTFSSKQAEKFWQMRNDGPL